MVEKQDQRRDGTTGVFKARGRHGQIYSLDVSLEPDEGWRKDKKKDLASRCKTQVRYDENLHTLGNWKSQASGPRCLWLGSINSCPSQWRPLGDSSRKSQLTKITFCFSCLSDFEKGLIILTNKAEN